jgi:glycopeptide antibiotics resistance protein
MNVYLVPLFAAAMAFPLIAFVLTLPYILYSYRRYGSVSFLRSVILFSFLFYLQCAYYLVILPLPDPAEVATRTSPYYQLIPFYFLYDAITHLSFDLTTLHGWLSLLRSHYVYEPAFNLLFTVPFGIYLAYYFKSSLTRVLLLTFALSLFFELSQLSGLFGLYPRPYRLADVDDLILNTLGGIVGYLCYTKCLRFLPSKERIDQRSAERSVSVSYSRRLTALFVDTILAGFIAALVTIIFEVDTFYSGVTVLLVYYPLFALLTHGKTPGKALVRIKLETVKGARPFWLLVLLRYMLRAIPLVLYQTFALLTRTEDAIYQTALLLAALALSAFLVLDVLLSFRAKRKKRLWYELLSKTHNVSSFRRQEPCLPPRS